MPSLVWKVALVCLLVGLIGAGLVALLARWFTLAEFDRLVSDQALDHFMEIVSHYYRTHQSWAGVARVFQQPLPAAPQQQEGESSPPIAQPPLIFVLADLQGRVVVPAAGYRLGERIPAVELARGTPLEVDGRVVGTVLTVDSPPLDPREERYLERNNRALFYAAVGATAVALILGALLARTLARPVRELTAAAQDVARGELGRQVPVRGQDELAELAAAFNQMSADLARSNALRQQMTADIAHDLRTPLTVVTGYLESMREGVLSATPERIETMYQEAQHLNRLVEDLRTLSLADAGELTLNRVALAPLSLLERTAAAHSYHAQEKGVALRVEVAPTLPQVEVDPDRMAQVLGNLVANALRHTPAGGQVVLSAALRGAEVALMVQDSGEGIPPEALPRLFDRFYRVDPARRVAEGESGLGLAIAKSIVELHRGTIKVRSALGEGTVFTVLLPVAAALEEASI